MDADLSLGLIYHLKRLSHTRFRRTVPLTHRSLGLFANHNQVYQTELLHSLNCDSAG
jgi:hypothetical protein